MSDQVQSQTTMSEPSGVSSTKATLSAEVEALPKIEPMGVFKFGMLQVLFDVLMDHGGSKDLSHHIQETICRRFKTVEKQVEFIGTASRFQYGIVDFTALYLN